MNRYLLALAATFTVCFSVLADDKPKGDADNTSKNQRDRQGDTKTPLDQSNAAADLKITADIRQALVKDKSFTMTATNIKIITTAGGRVTLRGPVATGDEKTKIFQIAESVAGVGKVENQLEVKATK